MSDAHITETGGRGRTRIILTAFDVLLELVVHEAARLRLSHLLKLFDVSPHTLRGPQACLQNLRIMLSHIEGCQVRRLHF